MMKGTPMLVQVLLIVDIILTIYVVYRWRSNRRLEATFKHLLKPGPSWSTGPKPPTLSPDVLRSMRKHPSYQSKRHVGKRR